MQKKRRIKAILPGPEKQNGAARTQFRRVFSRGLMDLYDFFMSFLRKPYAQRCQIGK
jgi:hypothetical protein